MNLFAISDETILSIINSVLQFLGTVLAAIMAYFMAKLNSKAKEAATVAKDVAEKADTNVSAVVNKLDELTSATHATNELISKNV